MMKLSTGLYNCFKSFKQHFPTGVVTSPNFPDDYPHNLYKTETIKVRDGLTISLQFIDFDIHIASSGYCYDHLAIMDGNGTTLMEESCGSSLPAKITSTTNTVDLIFITSSVNSKPGWKVIWSAVTPGECLDYLLFFSKRP